MSAQDSQIQKPGLKLDRAKCVVWKFGAENKKTPYSTGRVLGELMEKTSGISL
jgi:hypothetical protein